MNPIRFIARPMLAAIFVGAGIDTLRRPEPRAKQSAPVLEPITQMAPAPFDDPVNVVRANAVLHLVAGSTVALGIAPRLSALALAGSLIPTTFGGHRFWEIDDPVQRGQQQAHFLKNAAIMGGLLLVVSG